MSKENQDFLLNAQEAGETASHLSKVMKEYVDIEFNTRQNEIDMLEFDEITLTSDRAKYIAKEVLTDDDKRNIEQIDKVLAEVAEKKKELEKEKTPAKLFALKYRDFRLVQTAIQEALITTQEMGFDNETRLCMVIREKKLMTIYCTLRKANNPTQRFFASLEEIVQVSEKVIDDLHDKYTEEFVLTETERKK